MSKEKINKSIDFSNLPIWKKGEGNHKEGIIKWINSIGYKVPFIYDDIKGEFEIVDYNSKTQYFIIRYNDKDFRIARTGLIQCALGKMIGKRTHDFKLSIGETIKDAKRDLVIIDREYRKNDYGQDCKWYKYHCNKCGAELWIIESALLGSRKRGCSCCASRTVVKGINDIATTHPHLIPLFKDIEDAYTHTKSSIDKVWIMCPNCGFEKLITIKDLIYQGVSCPRCSDGISLPEKIMFNVLDQLSIDFIYQLSKTTFKWCDKYKYDFYFELDGEKYIIETNGLQHYKETFFTCRGRTLEEEKKNDKIKKELALKNGIKEENYIVIDCRCSALDWIKEHILNSKLNELFDLSVINWNLVAINSQKSIMKQVCDYWNTHNNINNEELSTNDLSKIFKLHRATIRRYLKEGTKNGWCYYNVKKENKKKVKYRISSRIKKGKSVICENKEFNTIKECSEYYNVKSRTITHWLNHDCKMPKKFFDMGLHYKDESMDDYEYFEIKEKKEKRHNKKEQYKYKQVICITTGKIFNKIVDGARYYNCNSDNISSCCVGKRKTCGKLKDGTKLVWKYINDLTDEEYIKYDIENKLNKLNKEEI